MTISHAPPRVDDGDYFRPSSGQKLGSTQLSALDVCVCVCARERACVRVAEQGKHIRLHTQSDL